MLLSGRTSVPNFVGLTWLDAAATAVRHRVVREACPLATVAPGRSISSWTVVDQDPCPGTTVPVGAGVTLYVLPAGGHPGHRGVRRGRCRFGRCRPLASGLTGPGVQ